jgi:FKBP-type peptidyl-prolyl cis-trans isomerase FklB
MSQLILSAKKTWAKEFFRMFVCCALGFQSVGGYAKPMNTVEKESYALGAMYGESFKNDFKTLDVQAFQEAFRAAFENKPLKLTPEAMKETLMGYQQKQMQARKKESSAMSGTNQKTGAEFLAKNAKQKGVVTTASGLQYLILKDAKGAKPQKSNRVKVHYHGSLPDGRVFDSSVDRGEPIVFGVTDVISGWTEALQLMSKGAKYRLFIPANLAYGDRGAPGSIIGPNQVLVFDVELLEIL